MLVLTRHESRVQAARLPAPASAPREACRKSWVRKWLADRGHGPCLGRVVGYVGGCCLLPGSGRSKKEPCPTDVLISFGDGICFWDRDL